MATTITWRSVARLGVLASALGVTAFGCGDEITRHDDPTARVRDVRIGAPVAEVDPRFLSVAVDAAQVVGGKWWTDVARVNGARGGARQPELDFGRVRLRKLAAPLAPAFVRIGGSTADDLWYDLSETPVDMPPPGFRHVLDRRHWTGAADFARALGFDLMFTLNAGPGPRGPGRVWTSTNAASLVRFAAERGDPVEVWELGNEVNAFPVLHGLTFKISAEQYAEDLQRARGLLERLHPGSRLAGPSSAYWPDLGEVPPFLEAFMPLGGPTLDVVTWHYYPQQSRRCALRALPADVELMHDPNALDEVHRWADVVERETLAHAPGAPIWMSETGNAQCGGEPGLSDRYPGGFWWIDQLGLLARRGQPVIVRQSLTGADYGLLSEPALEPRPDYWSGLLWKRLMGTRVLDVEVAGDRGLRVYAHCPPDGPGLSIAVLNLRRERGAVLRLQGVRADRARAFRLAPSDDGRGMTLNGKVLEVDDAGELPSLEGEEERLDPDAPELWMPAGRYGFFFIEGPAVPACGPT